MGASMVIVVPLSGMLFYICNSPDLGGTVQDIFQTNTFFACHRLFQKSNPFPSINNIYPDFYPAGT